MQLAAGVAGTGRLPAAHCQWCRCEAPLVVAARPKPGGAAADGRLSLVSVRGNLGSGGYGCRKCGGPRGLGGRTAEASGRG
jgi:hypothetical protein